MLTILATRARQPNEAMLISMRLHLIREATESGLTATWPIRCRNVQFDVMANIAPKQIGQADIDP